MRKPRSERARFARLRWMLEMEEWRDGLWYDCRKDPTLSSRACRYHARAIRLSRMVDTFAERLFARIDDLEERVANGIPSDAAIDAMAEYHHANVKDSCKHCGASFSADDLTDEECGPCADRITRGVHEAAEQAASDRRRE